MLQQQSVQVLIPALVYCVDAGMRLGQMCLDISVD